MNSYDSVPSPKASTKWLLWSLVFLFLITLTTFTILEVRTLHGEEPSVIHIIMNSIKRQSNGELAQGDQPNKFVLVNVENVQQGKDELVRAIVTQVEEQPTAELERKTREAPKTNATTDNKNYYYEEQTPVVVYSKTDQAAPLSYRQSAPVPYQQGSQEEQPYYDGEDNRDYANDEGGYYRPQYDDDSREDFPGPQDYGNEPDSGEGRSSQNREYDAYYSRHYATPSPPSSASGSNSMSSFSKTSSQGNRKLQTMTAAAATATGGGTRDPYRPYMADYDYMNSHRSPAVMSQKYQQQQQQQQQQQLQQRYRPQVPTQAVQKQKDGEGHEMNFLTILKTLKTVWDLYQSFASAWNSMAEKRDKQEELAKQKYKQHQQQLRINSKKPPKIDSKKKPENTTKNAKNSKQTTAGSTTTTTAPDFSTSSSTEEEEVEAVKPQQLQKTKVEPRKTYEGDSTSQTDAEGLRKKRQAEDSTQATESTDVGEGRYIKGDPLKGYYDFVITEGSYKFWAAFQVGTALLIIYSTFAAIYYSKVNPLVSDYDYTDYLGGGRSLSGGDLDFVDDETAEGSEQSGAQHSKGWLGWMPRTGHSLKFILDAIDKLPVDHAVNGDDSSIVDGGTDDVAEDLNESRKNKAM